MHKPKNSKCVITIVPKDSCTIFLKKGRIQHSDVDKIDPNYIYHYDKYKKLIRIERISRNMPCQQE
jgi:hypothetical protein